MLVFLGVLQQSGLTEGHCWADRPNVPPCLLCLVQWMQVFEAVDCSCLEVMQIQLWAQFSVQLFWNLGLAHAEVKNKAAPEFPLLLLFTCVSVCPNPSSPPSCQHSHFFRTDSTLSMCPVCLEEWVGRQGGVSRRAANSECRCPYLFPIWRNVSRVLLPAFSAQPVGWKKWPVEQVPAELELKVRGWGRHSASTTFFWSRWKPQFEMEETGGRGGLGQQPLKAEWSCFDALFSRQHFMEKKDQFSHLSYAYGIKLGYSFWWRKLVDLMIKFHKGIQWLMNEWVKIISKCVKLKNPENLRLCNCSNILWILAVERERLTSHWDRRCSIYIK